MVRWDEERLRNAFLRDANHAAFSKWKLVPRRFVDVSKIDMATRVLRTERRERLALQAELPAGRLVDVEQLAAGEPQVLLGRPQRGDALVAGQLVHLGDRHHLGLAGQLRGVQRQLPVDGVEVGALQRHRCLVEQAPDAILFADADGVIRLWNRGAERIFGATTAAAGTAHTSLRS